jgi:acetoin utilization protein AcuB
MVKVKDVMSASVFTVGPDETVDRVFFLMSFEKIRHLPVVEHGKLVGIVSDRDLSKVLGLRRQTAAATAGSEESRLVVVPRRVRHIMHRGVISIGPEESVGAAAGVMARRKIGALPVLDKRRKLVGIVTATDLLRALARLTAESSARASGD